MKPARPRPDALDPAKRTDDEIEPTEADDDAPLTAEERARLLAELEAEFEAAERSIREEGTISAEEFLRRRADYWEGVAKLRGAAASSMPSWTTAVGLPGISARRGWKQI